MNEARVWTVVKPTVGLPLLLGSVTLMAFVVHYAVLTHTTWIADYWQGGKIKKAEMSMPAPQALASIVQK